MADEKCVGQKSSHCAPRVGWILRGSLRKFHRKADSGLGGLVPMNLVSLAQGIVRASFFSSLVSITMDTGTIGPQHSE